MASPALSLDDSAAPAGHRGPRGLVLLHLKRETGATAGELAELLGYSLNAIRHHLKELEAEGVVGYDRTPSGVGAPAHTYHLTRKGHALFPDRYERTIVNLLDHVVATSGREAAVALLEQQYHALAERIELESRGVSDERRGEVIARVLDAEGYMATWSPAATEGVLTEHHCPHRLIAERFPEICAAEERFLARVFAAPIERRSRIAGGCGTCSYGVALSGDDAGEEAS